MATEEDKEAFTYLSLMLASGKVGVDIGGTASKVAFLQDNHDKNNNEEFQKKTTWGKTGERAVGLELDCAALGGRVCFLKWATYRVGEFCKRASGDFRRVVPAPRELWATGGGAHKFQSEVEKTFNIKSWKKIGEFDSLTLGFRHLTTYHPDTIYTVTPDNHAAPAKFNTNTDYPCAVCNIGSGVSVLKIDKDGGFERLGGTSIGGSTFFGLSKLLAGAKTFQQAVDLASKGDSTKVDITIRDIYGEEVDDLLGLPGDIAASSFGKLVAEDHEPTYAPADLASALLDLITQAIMQIASGFSARGGCRSLFFTGGFIRDNHPAACRIAFFCRLLNEKAMFLKHSEYVGALGCLLKAAEQRSKL